MTKSRTRSNDTALARLDFFGPPPLLTGEDFVAYNALLAQVAAAVGPADPVEEIWVRDVVNLTWEILRWHRLKANLITANTYKGVRVLLNPLVTDIDAEVLAKKWANCEPDAVEEVEKTLASAGLSIDAAVAQTVAIMLSAVERFDRMTMAAEVRRNAALREIDRHRTTLGQALRRASDEIIDAEIKQIEVHRVEDRRAA